MFQLCLVLQEVKKYMLRDLRPDIKVPMREIELSPTTGAFGEEENPPVRVYDTSGSYTDSEYPIDIHKGLAPIRRNWVLEREDVEEYEGREIKPEDNGYKKVESQSKAEMFFRD